jgi:hypothetical protein
VLAGEEIRLAFELGNISDAVVEGDDVALRLTLPNALQPTGLIVGATVIARANVAASRDAAEIASPNASDDANDGAFTLPSGITLPASGFGGGAEDGGVALRLAVPALATRSTAGIAIGLRVAHEVRPYAAIPWAIELGLRGRAVEIQSSATVAAPRYETASTPAPVLLVGSDAMDEREHLAWARIFETLSLPFDVWDADRQAGARAGGEPASEEGQDAQGGDRDRTGQRGEEDQEVQADSGDSSEAILARHAGGLIVLPTPPEGRPELLSLARIVRHFAPRHRDPRPVARFTPSDAPPRADGGLLLWGAEVESVLAPLFAPAPEAPGHGQDLRRIELRWRRPDKEDRAQLLLGLREELEREQPDRRWRVHLTGEPRRQSPVAWHYGTIQVEGLVLSAGHRLCVVPPKRAGRIGFEALLQPAGFPLGADDQPFLTPRAFTRAFTAVVAALPMPLKLHALRAVIAMPPSWRLENPAVGLAQRPDATWDVLEVVGRAIAAELAAERRRPIPRSPSGGRADEGGGAGRWAPRIGAGGGGNVDDAEGNELDTALIQTGDAASLPRLEILREAVLARPDRFVAGDGLRILFALLEHMTDRGPLIALGRWAAIERRRIQRSRAILREIEGAMQAVGAGDGRGHANGADGSDERPATRPRRDPRQLARAWRAAPGWAWVERVTRPGGGG